MNQITVIKKNGTTFNLFDKAIPRAVESATQNVELLGRDTVSLTVKSALPITFDVGDKIVIIGRVYTLNLPPVERKAGARLYFYDLEFEGMQYELMRAAYSVNVDTTTNEIQDISGDSLTGDLKLFLDVLVSNANRVFGSGSWAVGSYPANTETKTLSFAETDNCLNVLQSLCSEDNYNAEFWITIDGFGNMVLNVGASGSVFATTFEYGKDKGLYELTRERLAQSNVITRLHAYGSSKNIVTSKYIMPDGTFRGLRLCLPTKKKGTSFLDDATAISKFGLWEATKHFDDIYPNRTGTVSDYGDTVLKFVDSSMDFDINELEGDGVTTKYLIAGTSAKIHFATGNLAGYEFELEKYDHSTKTFNIIQQTDENGYKFPSETSAAFTIEPGDKYVITDIYLPTSYVTAAENKLLAEATAYLNKYKSPQVKYSLTVDPMFLKTLIPGASSNIFWAGDYIPIKDAAMGIDTTIRVKSLTRDLIDEYKYTLTITDLPVTVSTVTRIVNELKELDTIVKYNNLGDPARARRNYKVTGEVLTMVEALQVEAALIGNDPAAQFELVGVSIMANHNGQASALYASGGIINHNYYPEGGPASWNITPGSFGSLVAGTPYYLYVKATKGSSNAIYVLSATKIAVESVVGYYHFPVGVLSSVIDNVRVFTSTKGYTLITGDSIKTGKIQSASVPNMYIDLSTGEIRGNFKFTTGQTIQDYVGGEIGGIKVGASNLLTNSANPLLNANNVGTGTSVLMTNEPEPYYRATPTAGQVVSLFGAQYMHIAGRDHMSSIYVRQNSGSPVNMTLLQGGNVDDSLKITSVPSGVWTQISTKKYTASGNSFLILVSSLETITIDYKKVKIEYGTIATDWSPAPEDVQSKISETYEYVDGIKADLQSQIDGNITSWFYDYVPLLSNLPASGWTESEKALHLGDLFYNTTTGYAYRFQLVTGVYSWGRITDTDVVKALQDAANAKDTADQKRRIFGVQPYTPYDVGDLWAQGVNGDIYRCINSRQTGDFNSNDWEKASKYTDDTAVNNLEIGNENYYTGTNELSIWSSGGSTPSITRNTENSQNGFEIVSSNGGNLTSARVSQVVKENGYHVVTCMIKVASGTAQIDIDICDNNAGSITATTSWQKLQVLANVNNYSSEIYNFVDISTYTYCTLYVKDFMVQRGNKSTSYKKSTEYLTEALQGSTDISGGLLATNVLLMKTLAGIITGGMSGLASDNIGMWTGGTYQQAIDALAKVIFRKDGSGQLAGGKILWDLAGALNVGNFKIENGAIVGKDAGAIERLKLSIEDIQSIASMANNYAYATDVIEDNGYVVLESVFNPDMGAYFTQIISGSTSMTTIVRIVLPYATYINVETPAIGFNFSNPENVVSNGTTRNVTVKNLSGGTVATGNVNTNIQISAAGTYDVEIYTEIGVTLADGTGTYVDYFLYNTFVKYIESVEKTWLGKDGFFSYFSSSEYIHFKKTQGLKVKGATDLPGVLASGSISSTGTVSRNFGAKYVSGSKTGTGTYRINHSIGHTDYAVQLTCQTSARLAYVGTKYNDYVIIYATNTSGTLTDTGLEFLITGSN